jgi:hypothetical protein
MAQKSGRLSPTVMGMMTAAAYGGKADAKTEGGGGSS